MENFSANTIKHWYLPVLVGLLFLGTGIYTFFQPLEAYLSLALLFGYLFLASGIFEIFTAFSTKNVNKNWGMLLLYGAINAIFGFILVSNLALDMEVLPLYIGFVILFRSISSISYYSTLKSKGIKGTGSIMTLSILGAIFGFLILISPAIGGITIIVWTGSSFVLLGILGILLGLKLKSIR